MSLETELVDQMAVMVTMSKEIRQQFTANAALRAELLKVTGTNDAYKRELKNEQFLHNKSSAELTKVIGQNYKLTQQVHVQETQLLKLKGTPFHNLKR